MVDDQLSDRLRELIGEGSVRAFAAAAGLSEGTLRSVLKGTRPSIDLVVAIAEANNVSLTWLATGEGPKSRFALSPISVMYLTEMIELVEDWLEQTNRVMTPRQKAEMVTRLYEFVADDAAQGRKADVTRLQGILRLVA